MVCFFLILLTSGILLSISVTLVLKSVFLTKLLTSGILFSTAVNFELVVKPVMLGILPYFSATLVLKSVFFNHTTNIRYFLSILLILYSKSDPSFSYLAFLTKL